MYVADFGGLSRERRLAAYEAAVAASEAAQADREALASELSDSGTSDLVALGVGAFMLHERCEAGALRAHMREYSGDALAWPLAACMARVNRQCWAGAVGQAAQIAERWSGRHEGAPEFGEGVDGKALAFWLNAAKKELEPLRRYWFKHIVASALMEDFPSWLVGRPLSMEGYGWVRSEEDHVIGGSRAEL